MTIRDLKNERIRIDIYRQMSGEQKVLVAAPMYEDAIANNAFRNSRPIPKFYGGRD